MSKRVFDTYHASAEEIAGVKQALDADGIAYYETHKGIWGVGSAAIWLPDAGDYPAARRAIAEFQQQWRRQVRAHPPPTGIYWPRLPLLLLVAGLVLYLNLYWFFID